MQQVASDSLSYEVPPELPGPSGTPGCFRRKLEFLLTTNHMNQSICDRTLKPLKRGRDCYLVRFRVY
jgi:hypothetical protein